MIQTVDLLMALTRSILLLCLICYRSATLMLKFSQSGKNEFLALSNLIDRFDPPPGTSPIFIADRGFHSYNVFAHAIEKALIS